MADQGKWFKLWCSSLIDDSLENLELDNWARWARFGTWLKQQGKSGKVTIEQPATALKNLFRLPDFEAVITAIRLFPNYTCEEIEIPPLNETVPKRFKYLVKVKNWNKYQGDYSYERVKKHRKNETAKETAQEEKRSRSKKENKNKKFIPPTFAEVVEFAKTESLPLDASKFFNHYSAKGWMMGKTKVSDWKACAKNAAADWAKLDQQKALDYA